MDLAKKSILITGAAQGLGKQLAKKLAKKNARIILLDKNKKKLAKTAGEISKIGKTADYFVCDIRENDSIKNSISSVLQQHKTIDILINNAGIWTDDELEKSDPDRRLDVLKTNILGQIQITETLLPHLKKQERSTIFNIISSAGVLGIPAGDNSNWKTYGASKWGLTGYTHALRDSLRDTNIKVVQFFPGGFESNLYEGAGRTDPHDQPWMMKASDVADIVLFTLSRPDDVYIEQLTVSKHIKK